MTAWKKHIFLHIPKTAGTTLTSIIGRNYNASEIKTLYNPQQFDDDLNSGLLDAHIKMLYGHFAYDNTISDADYYTFTFLREPISRCVSNYIHLKNSLEPQHLKWMKDVKTFPDFLNLKQAFNWQARHLSGQKFHADFGKDLKGSLEKAQENLERMNLVGLTEFFEDSLLCLSKDLGWKNLKHKNENVQTNNSEAAGLIKTYSDQIVAKNELDIALYNQSKRRFEEKVAKISLVERISYSTKKLR